MEDMTQLNPLTPPRWTVACRLINLPDDLQAIIFGYLDCPTLACLARACRCLRIPAETVLFRDIRIELWDHRAFLAGSREPASSLSKALAFYARSLTVNFTQAFQAWAEEDEHLENARLVSMLQICSPGRLQALTVIFPLNACISPDRGDIVKLANSQSFQCRRLSFEECSWAVLEPFVVCSGSSLLRLHWSVPLVVIDETGGAGNIQTFNLQAAQVPNLKNLSLSLGVAEPNVTIALLEQLSFQLRCLTLNKELFSFRDDSPWTAAQLPDWNFPDLRSLSCKAVPADLYLSIISTCPDLQEIVALDVPGVHTSLLDTLPASIQFLGTASEYSALCINQTQEPYDSLLQRFSRFRNLQMLPRIMYEGQEDDDPALSCTKGQLLAHFEDLGIESSEEERQNFLIS